MPTSVQLCWGTVARGGAAAGLALLLTQAPRTLAAQTGKAAPALRAAVPPAELPAEPESWETNIEQATLAYASGSYPQYLQHLQRAEKLGFHHPRLLYSLARAYALNNQPAAALAYLQKLGAMGLNLRLESEPDLNSLRRLPEFKAVAERLERNRTPQFNSQTRLQLPVADFHPQSLAWDEASGTLFLGSGKRPRILRLGADNLPVDWIAEPQAAADGLYSVAKLQADPRRRLLWVSTAVLPQTEGAVDAPMYSTAVLQYDLRTGRCVRRYRLKPNGAAHVFSDMALRKNGGVLVADEAAGALYEVQPALDAPRLVAQFPALSAVTAILLTPDERYVFLADYVQGLHLLNLRTGKVAPVMAPDTVTTAGITGLLWHNGSILAFQTGIEPQRLVRLRLAPATPGGPPAIVRDEVVESNHPLYDTPVLGFVRNGTLVYVANAQPDSYGMESPLMRRSNRRDISILELKLPN